MKQYTSTAAKNLITVIGTEYVLAQRRVERGFIESDRMLGTLLERLNRLAVDNANLRQFLDHGGFVPRDEDESMDHSWAEPPQDGEKKPNRPRFTNIGNRLTSGR